MYFSRLTKAKTWVNREGRGKGTNVQSAEQKAEKITRTRTDLNIDRADITYSGASETVLDSFDEQRRSALS
jgi:hypothetical protein